MELEKKAEVEILLKNILRDYIPHLDMVLFNNKEKKYSQIFWFYKEKLEKFCLLMNYLYSVLRNEINENSILKNKFKFSKLEEINLYFIFVTLKKIEKNIFLPIINIIKSNLEIKKVFEQVLISTKKLVFLNRFLENIITFDKNDIFSIDPIYRENDPQWQEFRDCFFPIKIGTKEEMKEIRRKEEQIVLTIVSSYVHSHKGVIDIDDDKNIQNMLDDKKFLKEICTVKENHNNLKTDFQLNSKFVTKSIRSILASKKEEHKESMRQEVELFNAFPNSTIITQMWNITESKLAKAIRKFTLEKINTKSVFYIDPNLFDEFFPNCEISQFSKLVPKTTQPPVTLEFKKLLPTNIFDKSKSFIGVRLLHHEKFKLQEKIEKLLYLKKSNSVNDLNKSPNILSKMKKFLKKSQSEDEIEKYMGGMFSNHIRDSFKRILIDIHGGAFIASTSSYHQGKITSLLKKNGIEIENPGFRNRLQTGSQNEVSEQSKGLRRRSDLDLCNLTSNSLKLSLTSMWNNTFLWEIPLGGISQQL